MSHNNDDAASPMSVAEKKDALSRTERQKQRRLVLQQQLNSKGPCKTNDARHVVRNSNARSKEFRNFLFATFAPLKAYAEFEAADGYVKSSEDKDETAHASSLSVSGGAVTVDPIEAAALATPVTVRTPPPVYVLDVAGGKDGDVAIPLRIRGVNCGIVDPRVTGNLVNAKPMRYVRSRINVEGSLAGIAMRRRLASRGEAMVRVEIDDTKRAKTTGDVDFTEGRVLNTVARVCAPVAIAQSTGDAEPPSTAEGETMLSIRLPDMFAEWFTADGAHDSEALASAKARCDLVVGMHPDQATEPIVDFALANKKPFAIVPCCVFPSENPHRKLILDEASGEIVGITNEPPAKRNDVDEKTGCKTVHVESYDQFIEYLIRKAPPGVIKTAQLPIEGRSTIVYCAHY